MSYLFVLARLTQAKDVLQPFLELVKRCKFSDSLGLTYVTTKYQVVLNYCTNILYYLMLKADRIIVNSHPVIKRLAQYRQLLNQLESGEGTLLEDIIEVLRAAKENPSLYSANNAELGIGRKRRVSGLINEKVKYPKIDDEISKQESIEQFEEEQSEMEEESADENENQEAEIISNDVDGKRAITRQIAKNKGLTPYRKKELRNPRVKHRNKYRKAKIRRKGAVCTYVYFFEIYYLYHVYVAQSFMELLFFLGKGSQERGNTVQWRNVWNQGQCSEEYKVEVKLTRHRLLYIQNYINTYDKNK